MSRSLPAPSAGERSVQKALPSVLHLSVALPRRAGPQEALDSSIEELGQTFEIKFLAPATAGELLTSPGSCPADPKP